MNRCRTGKMNIAILLVLSLIAGMIFIIPNSETAAISRTLLLSQAKKMALANSSAYRKTKSQIALKEVSYKQAVKSLQLKKKNMETFRWSPLLSFKFPEKTDLVDSSEFTYKPMQIQTEITSLKHNLTDVVYEVNENTSNLYTEAYGLQSQITFIEEQLDVLEQTLERNTAKLALGEANQSDVDAIYKSISTTKTTLSEKLRRFEQTKEKLSELIDLDITTGYVFLNPYLDVDIPRTELNQIMEYTLSNSQTLFSAKLDTQLALLSLNTNYNLMSNQYGGFMSYINAYIQQAKSGEKLNTDSFKASYDSLLTAIDERWQGVVKILFIKIPKLWFKGQIDGVRYVEDEPYALYEATLEYQEKLKDQNTIEKEISTQVRDGFETLVSARNSYLRMATQVKDEKTSLEKAQLLNSLGELTFEEYTELKDQYEQLQMDELEALQLYTTLLYSYDRLTCGRITKLFRDSELNLDSTQGGESYIIEEQEEGGARYYIRPIVEDNLFEFGIYIPESFQIEATHYELWCDGYQLGEKTEVTKTIRHLTLSTQYANQVYVRFYNQEEFVDDCNIDASIYEGELTIKGNYLIQPNSAARQIGTYRSKVLEDMSMIELTFTFLPRESIAYYEICNEDGKKILYTEPVPVEEAFRYFDFLSTDMSRLLIKCYDRDKNMKYEAHFNTTEYSVYTE